MSARIWPVCAIFLALTFGATAANAGVCHYQNLIPDFFAFEARTAAMAPDQRAQIFVTEFAPRHPDYYGNPDVFGTPEKLQKSVARFFDPARPIQFPGFAPLTDEHLHAVADAVVPGFEKAEAEFAKTFADFRCETDVGFGVSFLHFDGNVSADKDGREHLLFGIEMIALLHAPADMPVLFSHELFHVYHRQLLKGLIPADDSVTWWAMWEEGLATYVSRQMNAPLSEQQVLWIPADLAAQMENPGVIAQTANQMLADFDTAQNYSHWFQAGHSAPGLPSRAGYFMGLRLAEELGRTRSLSELAQIKPDEIKMLAKQFLQEQAAQR